MQTVFYSVYKLTKIQVNVMLQIQMVQITQMRKKVGSNNTDAFHSDYFVLVNKLKS